MKFIDKDYEYTYAVIPEGDHFLVNKSNEDGDVRLVKEIEEHKTKEVVQASLFNYAKENNLIPEFVMKIEISEELLFQGEVIPGKDYVKLSSEEIVEKVKAYFELKADIEDLTAEKTAEVKKIKDDYDDQIGAKNVAMGILEPIVSSGLDMEECEVSWERDVESEMMVLIRKDNLKALQCRPMNAEEKQKNDLFEKGDDDKNPDDDVANDAAEEKEETVDGEEQAD